ncbi:MAG: acetate--CoA ligase [Legionella sp.]|nr:MAG: acetate--CoA ligase [Legionella sp.]PJE00185.1 MAG: acetate--CoA ligase [Legionella sp.]
MTTPHTHLTHFWSEIAEKNIAWMRPWDQVLRGDFHTGSIQWFINAKLNVSVNCIDRHLPHQAEKPALIWEGDTPEHTRTLTFAQLHKEVNLMSNVLKSLHVKKGDVVAIYLPMIPEAVIAMLACARIGAVHTVVFAGFSALALRQRIMASSCRYLITADSFQRGGKTIALKKQADEATTGLQLSTLVIQHSKEPLTLQKQQYWWHELKTGAAPYCPPEPMDAEDPLFILYTSGSTGKPKGLVHTTAGYLVQTTYTQQLIFSCTEKEVFWSTADIGWITGHSYVVYGPLANGITTLICEGIPTWPDPSRNWRIIDRHQVAVFYTAPTAIRSLMKAGDHWLEGSSRTSLRLLGSVGEPINPEAWHWLYDKVGQGRCPIVDTWWQTETGAILISPQANDLPCKPGSARKPLPGITPVLLNAQGQELAAPAEGALAIKDPWPSIARTIAGDHLRYCQTYFANGYYLTGDGAQCDEEGDYWLTGRMDDVINVSGHRIGTAEVESALLTHPAVAESAIVGIPHDIKGQSLYAFVVLNTRYQANEELKSALIDTIKHEIGAIAKPDTIQFLLDLPKTRSGKIMRRILRKIASKEVSTIEELGDLSTLANPDAITALILSTEEKQEYCSQ